MYYRKKKSFLHSSPCRSQLTRGKLALAMANYLLCIAHLGNQQFVTFFREMYSQYMYILNKYYI